MGTKKKYRLTDESITHKWHKFYRIEAIKDFGDIKKGTKGGWVESECNLSHDGSCWVCDNAKVYGDATVCGDAMVFDNAMVYGKATVCGDARVCGKAMVYGNEYIYIYIWRCNSPKQFRLHSLQKLVE